MAGMLPALLFDLDGTLVDSAADIARALTVISIARGGNVVDASVVRPLVRLGAAALVSSALGDLAQDQQRDLDDFRTALGALPADPAAIYPGVEAMLALLAAQSHPMAIVTNKPEGLARTLLAGLAIDRYFPAIVGGDTTSAPKPHRAPIDHAIAMLGASAAAAVLIGDSDIDASAAQNAGVPFILFEGGYGADAWDELPIHCRFRNFSELPALIRSLTFGEEMVSYVGV
jgi:phosphoglycolate phosphatase